MWFQIYTVISFVFDFRMFEHNALSNLYGNLLQITLLWHRAARGTTRSARDPSSHTPAGAPQDDIVEQSSTVGSASAAEHRRFPSENRQTRRASPLLGFAPAPPLASANIDFLIVLLCN